MFPRMATSPALASRDATAYAYSNISQAALANLSEVLAVHLGQVTSTSDFQESYLKQSIINVALSTMFSGTFTVLAAVAAYVLCSNGIKRRTIACMLIATIFMWISTVVCWIATLLEATEAYNVLRNLASRNMAQADAMLRCLLDLQNGFDAAPNDCQQEPVEELLYSSFKLYNVHDCINTAALTVNVVIGDAIVWWRAWVLWPDNRVVRSICVIMILLTTVTGAVDTTDTCRTQAAAAAGDTIPAPILGFGSVATRGTMFSGDAWGIAAAISSLLTNVVATTLIAYRAWEHRRTIMSYLRGSSRRTQVERTLALLVESGVLYCALWGLIVTYELVFVSPSLTDSEAAFEDGFYYVMEGCVVPLIGMYPTLIIILCAVDKSAHEKSPLADDRARNRDASPVFYGSPGRRLETLSELLSATSVLLAPRRLRQRRLRTPWPENGKGVLREPELRVTRLSDGAARAGVLVYSSMYEHFQEGLAAGHQSIY
ncbi:hypothetical protein C8T65DRAFT_746850 [Cerioporus squamosus]|nr:hypothetical protein C8T65DRAFT_746850 [Cerioporus squamosus]